MSELLYKVFIPDNVSDEKLSYKLDETILDDIPDDILKTDQCSVDETSNSNSKSDNDSNSNSKSDNDSNNNSKSENDSNSNSKSENDSDSNNDDDDDDDDDDDENNNKSDENENVKEEDNDINGDIDSDIDGYIYAYRNEENINTTSLDSVIMDYFKQGLLYFSEILNKYTNLKDPIISYKAKHYIRLLSINLHKICFKTK